jgi:alpha-mannosidase
MDRMATLRPLVDNTPKIPHNINQSRINNFLAVNGQFYSMGIHQGLWKTRYSGAPHVQLSYYSVPDMKVRQQQKAMPLVKGNGTVI